VRPGIEELMSDSTEATRETEPGGGKRRGRLKRVLRVLAILLVLVVLALAVLLYNPVRTLATLEKVDDYPLYVMHYKGTYFFDLFAEEIQPVCWRYNKASEVLGASQGTLARDEPMRLLEKVKQGSTVWSIVYGLSAGHVRVAVGRDYDQVHRFQLDVNDPQ